MDNRLTPVKVVFRNWEGNIIALFPEEPMDNSLDNCCSYMHIGQHGAANYDMIVNRSKPATPDEYEALKQELESIGYQVTVLQRASAKCHQDRMEQIRQHYTFN